MIEHSSILLTKQFCRSLKMILYFRLTLLRSRHQVCLGSNVCIREKDKKYEFWNLEGKNVTSILQDFIITIEQR